MANGPLRITNSLFDPDLYKSEHDVEDPELKVRGGRKASDGFGCQAFTCLMGTVRHTLQANDLLHYFF